MDAGAEARALLAEVRELRADVARQGSARFRRWRPGIDRRSFAGSALNFAHYLALRRHDLRPLQRRLMVLGLSSLGRAEGRVLVTLDAVAATLASVTGEAEAGLKRPTARQFFRGEDRLEANASELFGAAAHGRRGRIMVTLGTDAADDPAVLLMLVERGTEVVRINCAHDDAAVWSRMFDNLRAAEARTGRRLRLLMDIAGPKVRTGEVLTPPEGARLHVGDELLLCRELLPSCGARFQTTCTCPQVFDRLKPGDRISIDDGKLRGTIIREQEGGFLARLEEGRLKGLKLKPERGLNFPMTDLGLDPLTAQDRADLDFAARHADLIGYSFVEKAEHVAGLQAELALRRPDWQALGLVAKIETPRAVKNLPEIIVQAAGRQPLAVMIARGDLAVEIGFERLAEMQEEMLWLCEAAHVPAIWATQVLEDLVRTGLPSRGEMTDAAMSSRAECVMLNKGPNVEAAIRVLDGLLRRMSEHQLKKTPTLRALKSWNAG
jgi:pyruvate kinase